MFFYKDKVFEQGIEYIQQVLNKMTEEYISLKSSLIPNGVKIQPIKSCLRNLGSRYSFISSYEDKDTRWGKNSLERTCQLAIHDHDELLKEVEKIHSENIPALEINNQIYKYVCKMFEQLGISNSYSTWEYSSNRSHTKKERTHISGYIGDLQRNCITNDGYSQAITQLESFKKQIEDYKIKKEQDTKLEQQKKEQELRKQQNIKNALSILDKYKKVLGVDYSMETAIDLAEELQMDEEQLFSKHGLNIIRNEFDGTEIIETNLVGEWRHGVNKEIIVQSTITKKFYKCFYQDSPKDSMNLEDMNPILEFEELPNYIKK